MYVLLVYIYSVLFLLVIQFSEWTTNSKYFEIFLLCLPIISFLDRFVPKLLGNSFSNFFFINMANLSLSRIILDTLHTVAEHYIENRPTALLISAWLVGVGHYYFFLPKTTTNNRQYIRFYHFVNDLVYFILIL